MHTRHTLELLVCIALLAFTGVAGAKAEQEGKRVPVILDTDIGTDIDDAFALALVLASPELDLRGVTTVGSDPRTRAFMVCRLLTAVGSRDIPVAAGATPQPAEEIKGQYQYRNHPAVIFNRTAKPVKESAVEFLYAQLKAHPGELTLLPIGPLTNIARLLREHPDCKPWIKRIVMMGGSVRLGYNGKAPADVEWNIKCDIKAAQTVFASGIPLVVAPLDATTMLKLEKPLRQRLFKAETPLTYQIQAMYQMWNAPTPTLFDPVAVALCFDERFCTMEKVRLTVDDKGMTAAVKGEVNARVATAIRGDDFLKWYVERVASAGKVARPKPPRNIVQPVERGGLPAHVHAFEDFETDIEKRWWMSGKVETANVPPNSRRACRGILTQDFDDLMGDMKTMYTAVVFNPVPGPPMGERTRLSFRYRLQGTDTLRVQIYSLTKGYHRYLALTGLPQGRWQETTVDMTQCRRPDGSGGPLSVDERIDDIQFYVDPAAELLIDDIVLYEAAPAREKQPFPRRILFTGWFDTGKQGKEWPGDFEIVPHKAPRKWKAAKSILNAEQTTPWIRVDLRGERTLGEKTHLRFRYHLSGAESMQVALVNHKTKARHALDLKTLRKGEWMETTLDYSKQSRKGERVDEIQFLLPKGAELLVDDLLLYEPGVEQRHR
ncbi:MAG TPA: nucleoside hydrolase [Gemmataceae bacterium]|nr:nucleoside hydrolase [Gemmataceae bacterium]